MNEKKHHILVVDDSRSVRSFFKEVFDKAGRYDAEFASCGEEAVELFEKMHQSERPFEFVLSDINMPGMDGFETLSEIRKIDPQIRTGMITGFNVDDYIKEALERGVFNIICKTDDPEDIASTIENLVTGENLLGIESYLEKGSAIKKIKIQETLHLKMVVNEIMKFAEKYLDEEKLYGLKTGLVEMGTNAIYHAHGYEKGSQVELKEKEEVYIEYGADSEKLAVNIVDFSGTLTKEKVLSQLNKCINPTQEDLIASGGRGLYLTRYLCDKFIINLVKNEKTEMLLFMFFNSDHKESKPLLVNQL